MTDHKVTHTHPHRHSINHPHAFGYMTDSEVHEHEHHHTSFRESLHVGDFGPHHRHHFHAPGDEPRKR